MVKPASLVCAGKSFPSIIELVHISGYKNLSMLKRYTHPSHVTVLCKIDKNKLSRFQ